MTRRSKAATGAIVLILIGSAAAFLVLRVRRRDSDRSLRTSGPPVQLGVADRRALVQMFGEDRQTLLERVKTSMSERKLNETLSAAMFFESSIDGTDAPDFARPVISDKTRGLLSGYAFWYVVEAMPSSEYDIRDR